jgi:hypothetical protein
MEDISTQERGRYFSTFRTEALHLEMRDTYATESERERLDRWRAGERPDQDQAPDWWPRWRDLMGTQTQAGKTIRRLRIISQPVTDYIQFEWSEADWLVKAGEQVRWLPRRLTSALLLPGNDCWIFDRETVAFTHFSGDGAVVGHTRTTDAGIVTRCVEAFESAWPLAIPHEQYQPA